MTSETQLKSTCDDKAEAQASDRSAARYRRAALAAVGSAAARAIQIGTTVVTVPVLLTYLGPERYGLWMTVSGTVAVLGFADLGLGNGVMTAIAKADGAGDRAHARRVVSNALALLLCVAACASLVLGIVFGYVDWSAVFNVKTEEARSAAGPVVAAFAATTLIAVPISIVQRIQIGYQDGAKNSMWQAFGYLSALGAVFALVRARAEVPLLVLGLTGVPVIAQMLNGIAVFRGERRYLRPRVDDLSATLAGGLLRTGLGFLTIQILAILIFNIDNIIVAQVLGAEAVAQFSIVARLFGIGSTLVGIATAPLWPAYSESLARGDTEWVRQALRRSLFLSGLTVLSATLVLVVFGRLLISAWVGEAWSPDVSLLIAFAAQALVQAIAAPLSVTLNGAQIVRAQVVLSILVALLVVPAKWWAASLYGPIAVPWCTALVQLLVWVFPVLALLRRRGLLG